MASANSIRNSLISKLLTINDQEFLSAIDKLVSSSAKGQKVDLTNEQLLMLKMSDEDIEKGQVVSQEKLFEQERKWLREQ